MHRPRRLWLFFFSKKFAGLLGRGTYWQKELFGTSKQNSVAQITWNWKYFLMIQGGPLPVVSGVMGPL